MFSAAIKSGAAASTPPDAQFNYVTMLLHGDGTNGAQNNTFLDSSTNNFTITRAGNTTQGSFSPYGSNWSNYFDGSGDDLMVANNTAFDFGSGDFTLEAWICPTGNIGAGYGGIITKYAASFQDTFGLLLNDARTIRFFVTYSDNSSDDVTSVTTVSYNTWNHIAVTRSGTTFRVFINGTQSNTFTNSKALKTTTSRLGIGNFDGYSQTFLGYISNARVVKGTAVYTAAFTPSTTPLTAISGTSLLTCQANRFKDSSSNAFAVTVDGNPSVQRFNPFGTSTAYSTATIGGSGYFDGSGDYLNVGSGSALNLTSGDWTIEGWVYSGSSTSGSYQCIYSNGYPIQIYLRNGDIEAYVSSQNNSPAYFVNGIGGGAGVYGMKNNTWNHFALVKNGTNYTVFVNGLAGTPTSSGSNPATPIRATYIGSYDGTQYFLPAYVSDLRVVNGTAVYTTNFTPPTAPLTAVSNTSLLCNMTNGAIYDNAMMNDLETVGNAQISTSVKKFGTGSMYFDGSSYLIGQNNAIWAFGTGDFTIEAWINPSSLADNWIIGYYNPAYTALPFNWYLEANKLVFASNGADRILSNANATPTSQWSHIAVCRSGTSTKMFVNGVQEGSTYTDTYNYAITSTSQPVIGSRGTLGPYKYVGYIDDLRITKGYARYTTAFTPPAAAFSNVGPISS